MPKKDKEKIAKPPYVIKIAVVLSGCGFMDGSEIHESVMTLWAIERHGACYQCFAPNIQQTTVIDHTNGTTSRDSRNVLVESARISRGKIHDLKDYKPTNYDALIFPGGFGVAINLSSFAHDGAECHIQTDVRHAILETHTSNKPIGALCIAPVLIAKLLDKPILTIGQDRETAKALNAMGANHQPTTHGGIVIDPIHKLVTTPCYMLESTLPDIADGTNRLVQALIRMIHDDHHEPKHPY